MTTITLPKSVLDYGGKPAIRTAVDHLLSSGGSAMPEDLDDWQQVRAYHGALLSAYQVRTEHALLMMDVSDSVWVPLLAATPSVGKPLTPAEQTGWDYEDPSPDALWDEGHAFHRTFRYPAAPGSIVDAAVRYDFDDGIRLHFAIWDPEGTSSASDVLLLAEPWEPKPSEYGYRITRAGLFVPTSDAPTQDLSNLIAAAGNAISSI